jgi:plasmid stabilization system protein ParE
MTRSVRVLHRAQQDVEGCYDYIAERSPPGAERWFNRFSETRDRLAIDAERRGLASESDFVDYEIREVLFKTRQGRPYRILFTIVDNEVLVLRVRGPGQDDVSVAEKVSGTVY